MNDYSISFEVESLRDLCLKHSSSTSITSEVDGRPDWVITDHRLHNTKADFFSLAFYTNTDNRSILLMEQQERALVMLLTTRVQNELFLLLSLRTEPGLIGLTNFSTTIQSTPSNYQQKHGGKSTHFIDYAINPDLQCNVIYDGIHYDWGMYYLKKVKRFLIVEVESFLEEPDGYRWVPLDVAKALLLENHLVTSDLRVCIPLLDSSSSSNKPNSNYHIAEKTIEKPLKKNDFPITAKDDFGTSIAFYKTQTPNREVQSWVQPFIVTSEDLMIKLTVVHTSGGILFALEKRTQPGLLGQNLWFPSNLTGGQLIREVSTSAEGGRFWRHQIHIQILEIPLASKCKSTGPGYVVWVTESELKDIILNPTQSSLELRMAYSLIYAGVKCIK